jgi:hypothetical protein
MLGSQRGHGVLWQVCLAHLLRDAKSAIACGDTAFSAPLRWLLLRAIAIGRRRETLKDTTLKQYLYDLDRRLDRIMAAVPTGEPGRKLHKRMLANRAHFRSVVSTAKANRASVLDTVRFVLSAKRPGEAISGAG